MSGSWTLNGDDDDDDDDDDGDDGDGDDDDGDGDGDDDDDGDDHLVFPILSNLDISQPPFSHTFFLRIGTLWTTLRILRSL